MDTFLEWYPKEHAKWFEILQNYFPSTMAGDRGYSAKTRDGFPVVIECLCLLDGHILKYVPTEELNWFYVYLLEKVDVEVQKIVAEKNNLQVQFLFRTAARYHYRICWVKILDGFFL